MDITGITRMNEADMGTVGMNMDRRMRMTAIMMTASKKAAEETAAAAEEAVVAAAEDVVDRESSSKDLTQAVPAEYITAVPLTMGRSLIPRMTVGNRWSSCAALA